MRSDHSCARLHARTVAGQAFRIVRLIVSNNLLMRVVAGEATHPLVHAVEATAIGQPIRLKPHVHWAAPSVPNDRLPGAMALAAKIRQILGREPLQLRRYRIELAVR